MKVIMLRGPRKCGKTPILTLCDDTLMNIHGTTIHTEKEFLNENDFKVILNYKGKTVAIYTMGDYSTKVIEAMKEYANKSVDVLIIACNSNLKRPMVSIRNYPHTIIPKAKKAFPYEDQKIVNEIIALIGD
jgi:predicted AAA+ superfamily ATPase